VHEEGYRVERAEDGELRFRHPRGWPIPSVPPPISLPGDPAGTIRAENESHGVHIHPNTATPSWLGERIDVRYALDVLHPRAGNG